MKAEKDKKTGKWLIQYRYTDWQGNRKKSTKRGFATKREAEEWARQFLLSQSYDFNMKFENFIELYLKDCETRLKLNTMMTKEFIVDLKIMPYFGKKKMNEITPANIREWQNNLLKQGYSQTYLKTINNQLSAIFNHAVRVYGLQSNPCHKVGSIGKSKAKEMLFWTTEEYKLFSEQIMHKTMTYMAFQVLYWCGIRLGELLALTKEDIDLEDRKIRINKSFQRIDKEDVITSPKTEKSNRIVDIPDFLAEELRTYIIKFYDLSNTDRLFPLSKTHLHNELKNGAKKAGIKRIRIHDLRHSHVSLLIEMGFSPLAIAERVGHESIDITYRYAHLFPSKGKEIANKLNEENGVITNDEEE